jgi:hypothetical protein
MFFNRAFFLNKEKLQMGRREIRRIGMDLVSLGQGDGPLAGACENGNESSGTVKYGDIPE